MDRRRKQWWEQKIRVTPADWMEGLGCLLAGRDWDGPWSRAARDWEAGVRREATDLRSQMETLGQTVSPELCRDAIVGGYSADLLALGRERAARAISHSEQV